MTHAFWPGLILAVLALALWADTYGWPRYRKWQRDESFRMRGLCPDCERPHNRCLCFREDPGW